MADNLPPPFPSMEPSQGAPAQPAKHGLFGGGKPAPGPDLAEILNSINDLLRRMRIMEERYTNLQRKLQVTEQNMINQHRTALDEIKTANLDIQELRRDIIDLREKMKVIIQELRTCAKKDNVTILKKYIEMWEPINFVTQREVERIVEQEVESALLKRKL
ncbi:hypothetical protein JXB02_02700 [Candidatus Woesearchaeota archaeon]|nr:hypothetical protein [Candidatus Woesearchaeota archaeon]